MTRIVSAFPGTGKSYLFTHPDRFGTVLDSDSSNFSWLHTADGKVRHPEFPRNYLNHIKSNIGSAALILVSSHEDVRTALVTEGLEFTLAFPERGLKEEYLDRFRNRQSPQGFIDLIDKNWDVFLEQLETQANCDQLVLGSGQYLSDVL